MLRPIDNYFLKQKEPEKSCLLFLRDFILKHDQNISEKWQYGMPFFYYKDKRFCYLWVQKKSGSPYLGFVEGKRMNHPDLLQEKRTRMKILLVDPEENIPVIKIRNILKEAIVLSKHL